MFAYCNVKILFSFQTFSSVILPKWSLDHHGLHGRGELEGRPQRLPVVQGDRPRDAADEDQEGEVREVDAV
jgi:hypothetical protein